MTPEQEIETDNNRAEIKILKKKQDAAEADEKSKEWLRNEGGQMPINDKDQIIIQEASQETTIITTDVDKKS